MEAFLSVTLQLHDNLGPRLQEVFVEETKAFLQEKLDADDKWDIDVTLTNLFLTDQTVIPTRRRRLHAAGLRLKFGVLAEARPEPPVGYDLYTELDRLLVDNLEEFSDRLSSASPAFNQLVRDGAVDVNALEDAPTVNDGGNGLSTGIVVIIILCAVAAVALAVCAVFIAIRRRRHSDESVMTEAKLDIYALEDAESHSTDITPYSKRKDINTTGKSFMNASPRVKSDEPGSRTSSHSNNKNTKSLLDAMINRADSESDEIEVEAGDLGLQLSANVLAAHATTGRLGAADPPANRRVDTRMYNSDDDMSPKSVNLTPASSVCSGASGNFLSRVLGARPMNNNEQSHYNGETDASLKRSGLYDVFAPSGPLGIVVDTSKNGPLVHSMKPTSSLLGLVSPGDLIVGLDDMDTRSMTAATLTRLMAKRSNQPERKITLLAVDNGNTD